jgi:hypothetical protein
MKSGDPEKQEKAKQELDELKKKTSQPEQQQPSELSEKDKAELKKAAKDLASKDETERKAAEKKLDEMIGKEKRDELQQDLNDLQGNDAEKAKQAREKIEKMADAMKNRKSDQKQDEQTERGGPSSFHKPGQPIEDNLENRFKTADLNLKKFKELRENPDFLKDSGYTPDEFEKFLRGYEEMVNRTRDEWNRERQNPAATQQSGKPEIRNDAGGERVKGRGETSTVQGTGGASVAPNGFSEAQKRFAEAAAKRAMEREKQK